MNEEPSLLLSLLRTAHARPGTNQSSNSEALGIDFANRPKAPLIVVDVHWRRIGVTNEIVSATIIVRGTVEARPCVVNSNVNIPASSRLTAITKRVRITTL
jgi:hypothetical protein